MCAPNTCTDGSSQVFQTLKMLSIANFDEYCWTSDTRNIFTRVSFDQFEGGFADFTFKDKTGNFAAFLARHGGRAAAVLDQSQVTWHCEVKSTKNSLTTEPFNLSQNQLNMARAHTFAAQQSISHVYVILHVFDMPSDRPALRAYVDPWKMFVDGKLILHAEGGYQCCEA